ncbi:MAG: MBL fold metallo-hydrolase [Chloroflexi bacterium]|nr:MBL fold metallo-hydrolase [Chloroflexota bacterium]
MGPTPGGTFVGVELSFLGAAGTVTGSRFLLSVNGRRYLIDCGLFQGPRALKEQNWEPFPVPADGIDAVLLTHAHIDHSGYLPRLARQGYGARVYATEATCALLEIMLPDAAHLQEQDAAYANKKGYSRHQPALPLYTVADAERVLERVRPVRFHEPLSLDRMTVTFRPAGHILGSATLELEVEVGEGRRRLVFSGDLGRYDQEVMKDPYPVRTADYLVLESTYGDRTHRRALIEDDLEGVIHAVVEKRGVLLIPAFAVGRTQQVLYYIRKLQDEGKVPDLPVYVDSPMASDVTDIYCRFGNEHNLDINLLMDDHTCPLRCRDTRFIRDVEASKALNTRPGPAIIISASGMCTGGRILHHLKWKLPDPRNTVLLVGYQVKGTRGRALLEGAKEITIHRERVPVRARIAAMDSLSGHADRSELLRWLSNFEQIPRRTFIVHGEPQAARSLQERIGQELGWEEVVIPDQGKHFALE